jgi:hypothetical protein
VVANFPGASCWSATLARLRQISELSCTKRVKGVVPSSKLHWEKKEDGESTNVGVGWAIELWWKESEGRRWWMLSTKITRGCS